VDDAARGGASFVVTLQPASATPDRVDDVPAKESSAYTRVRARAHSLLR
jgi:hypothetical protein